MRRSSVERTPVVHGRARAERKGQMAAELRALLEEFGCSVNPQLFDLQSSSRWLGPRPQWEVPRTPGLPGVHLRLRSRPAVARFAAAVARDPDLYPVAASTGITLSTPAEGGLQVQVADHAPARVESTVSRAILATGGEPGAAHRTSWRPRRPAPRACRVLQAATQGSGIHSGTKPTRVLPRAFAEARPTPVPATPPATSGTLRDRLQTLRDAFTCVSQRPANRRQIIDEQGRSRSRRGDSNP